MYRSLESYPGYPFTILSAVAVPVLAYTASKIISNNKYREKEKISFNELGYGGRVVAEVLHNQGVKFVFTLGGGDVGAVLVGCKQKGIRVLDVQQQATAVFAADATYRISGVPGVAVVTQGPGLTNTITAARNAYVAQSALVIISSVAADSLKGLGSLQEMDQLTAMKPHVKWVTHVMHIGDIIPSLEKAFAIAQSDTPGPVFVEIPGNLLYPESFSKNWYKLPINASSGFFTRTAFRLWSWWYFRSSFDVKGKELSFHHPLALEYPLPSHRHIKKVIQKLQKAEKPIMIIGSQAVALPPQNSTQNIVSLQAALSLIALPSFFLENARGLMGKDWNFAIHHNIEYAISQSDFVILAGIPLDYRLNYGATINPKATVVAVNRDYAAATLNVPSNHISITCDVATFLHKLSHHVPKNTTSTWTAWLTELRDRSLLRELELKTQSETKTDLANPLAVAPALENVIGENAIVVADGGTFTELSSKVIKPRGPNSWLEPGAFGSLGTGAGFCLASKLLRPDAEVWAILGDGACNFSLADFETLVYHNVPIIAVIGNDGRRTSSARPQIEAFNDAVGCVSTHVNFHELMKVFGGEGILVGGGTQQDIEDALMKAKGQLSLGKSVVVNILIGDAPDVKLNASSVLTSGSAMM